MVEDRADEEEDAARDRYESRRARDAYLQSLYDRRERGF